MMKCWGEFCNENIMFFGIAKIHKKSDYDLTTHYSGINPRYYCSMIRDSSNF